MHVELANMIKTLDFLFHEIH